jgi:hypothetical protein
VFRPRRPPSANLGYSLFSITRSGHNSCFSYTPTGERIYQSANTPITTYLLDGDNVVQENTSGVATNLLQGPGTDNLLQRGSNWLVPASLGSTSTVVDRSGSVQIVMTVRGRCRMLYGRSSRTSMRATSMPSRITGRVSASPYSWR